MPQTRRAKPKTRRAKPAGNAALDRLQTSIEGAESALKDLRREVGRDSRDRLNDLATTIKSARSNLSRSRQRIVKEMEAIEHSLRKGKKRPAAKGRAKAAKAARGGTTRSRKAATAKSTAKRRTKTAARSKTATRSKAASRSKAAAKPRARRTAKPAAKSARAA